MPTPISTAELEIGSVPSPNWLSQQFELFWPRLQEASNKQRIDSKYRPIILFYLGFFWIVGWTFWVIVTSLVPMFRRPLTMLGFLAVMGLLVFGWLLFANRNSNRWAKAALGIAVVILVLLALTFPLWSSQPVAQAGSQALIGLMLIVAAVLVVLSLLIVVGAFFAIYLLVGQGQTGLWAVATAVLMLAVFGLFLALLSPVLYPYPFILWAVGALLICGLGAAAFFVPIWHVDLKYGEIFLIADPTAGPEKFRLVMRPAPEVDKALIEAVIRAGAAAERVNKFLDYGGPQFMQEELVQAVGTNSQSALYQLFTQTRDPHRQPKAILRAHTFKKMRLVWTRSDNIKIDSTTVDNLITKEGTSLAVELGFACTFDPFDIREPDSWLKLADWESIGAMRKFFQDVLGWRARQIAQQYFVGIPLQSAMTDGSIKKFRHELAEKMAWAKDVFGLTLKPEGVQCRPLVPDQVRLEEINMLASHPRAQAETARIQALVEQVFKYNVPPKLLAGLLLVDKGSEKLVQSTFDDMLGLPDPDVGQREIYHQQKYYNQQPLLPQAPPNPTLPPSTPPPPPAPAPRGKRRSFNIGQRLTATRSNDGVFRVTPKDDDEDSQETKPS
ncbi:MAG TPA: DMT family transporter [Phototrophicaceae bacterium]|nr:DMT family transporter [Phototrophicaceae bacterium]